MQNILIMIGKAYVAREAAIILYKLTEFTISRSGSRFSAVSQIKQFSILWFFSSCLPDYKNEKKKQWSPNHTISKKKKKYNFQVEYLFYFDVIYISIWLKMTRYKKVQTNNYTDVISYKG